MPENTPHLHMLKRIMEVANILAQATPQEKLAVDQIDSTDKKHITAVSAYDVSKTTKG
jgi:hypothetical protein